MTWFEMTLKAGYVIEHEEWVDTTAGFGALFDILFVSNPGRSHHPGQNTSKYRGQ